MFDAASVKVCGPGDLKTLPQASQFEHGAHPGIHRTLQTRR